MRYLKFNVLFILLIVDNSFSHQGEKHFRKESDLKKVEIDALQKISESYQKNIVIIFKAKCFDCHGDAKDLPWYHSVPIAKKIMNDDMKEAKEHLDIREGFPFKGHGSPQEDLQAILETTQKMKGLPFVTGLMHWSTKLTKNEKKQITSWVKEGLRYLNGDRP